MATTANLLAIFSVAIISILAYLIFLSPPSQPHPCHAGITEKSSRPIHYLPSIIALRERVADAISGDPTLFISSLLKYGGPIIGREAVNDLEVLRDVCTSGRVLFDPVRKVVDVRNFEVHAPDGGQLAFRVGRFNITWDSYLGASPCVATSVEDVDIRVEFSDLLLSRTNFHVLREAGFPPALLVGSEKVAFGDGGDEPSPSRLRVASVGLAGKVTLTLESTALRGTGSDGEDSLANRKLLEDFVLDLSVLHALDERIRLASELNGKNTGSRGLTTDELMEITTGYFWDEVIKVVSLNVFDLVRGEEARVITKGADAIQRTKKSFLNYFGEAIETFRGRELDAPINKMLHRWGVQDEQAKRLKDAASGAVDRALAAVSVKIGELAKRSITDEGGFDTLLEAKQDLL